MKRALTVVLGLLLLALVAGVARAGNIDTTGNVFLGAGDGNIYEYTPSGSLVQVISTGTTGFITGMAFDSAGNLYSTDFSAGHVSQISGSTGAVITSSFVTGMAAPESIAVDSAGNFYITQEGGGGIKEFSPTGTLIQTLNAGTAASRSDWDDLAADQHTLLYSTESSTLFSTNALTNTANANISATGSIAAFRIVPNGADAGDILASQENGTVVLLSPTGTVLHTYSVPSGVTTFALNLDPNGTDFWTADITTNRVWEVNITTGAIDENWVPLGVTGGGIPEVAGLVVFGQITASGGGGGGGTTTPEPGTLVLVGSGILAIAKRAKKIWA